MNIKFKICDIGNHLIRVENQTQLTGGYLNEDSVELYLNGLYAKNKFKYSLTMTITVLLYTSSKGISLVDEAFNDHCSNLDEAYFEIEKDGYYTITELVLPSEKWFKSLSSEDIDSIYTQNSNLELYYTDGSKIYLYDYKTKKSSDGKSVEEILEKNEDELEQTTISFAAKDTFYVRYLRECYMFYVKNILNQNTFKCIEKNLNLKDFIWKRDFIWMTINALTFYTEDGQFYEAQLILERINFCGGLCSEANTDKKLLDCGCSKN